MRVKDVDELVQMVFSGLFPLVIDDVVDQTLDDDERM